jgi:hypothetical protein
VGDNFKIICKLLVHRKIRNINNESEVYEKAKKDAKLFI